MTPAAEFPRDRLYAVLIIDDHELFATTLIAALEASGMRPYRVAGVNEPGKILAQASQLPHGVAVLRARLGHDSDGHLIDPVSLIVRLRLLGWKVLVLSEHSDLVEQAAAVSAGALDLVPARGSFATMLNTIHAVADGQAVMPEATRQAWLRRHHRDHVQRLALSRRVERLSPGEQEVLDLLVQGHRAPAIAAHLFVSMTTVRTQIRSILTKLEVHSQLEAVALLRNHRPRSRTTDSPD